MKRSIIKELKIDNLLSFKADTILSLGALNVLIGANGGGKSNVIDILELVSWSYRNIRTPIKNSGSNWNDWIYSGATANDPISVQLLFTDYSCSYSLEFEKDKIDHVGRRISNGESEFMSSFEFDITNDVNDISNYNPIKNQLLEFIKDIGIYTDFQFGRKANNIIRQSETQGSDPRRVEEDLSNIGIILNKLQNDFEIGAMVKQYIQYADPRIVGLSINIENSILPYLEYEGTKRPIMKSRLSDGTLRYLSLVAILLNAKRYSLICIDEPDLGLNPSMTVYLAEMLIYASHHTQVIITTHSDFLVDALGKTHPESIITVKNTHGYTEFEKLSKETLEGNLEIYGSMGELMNRNFIG